MQNLTLPVAWFDTSFNINYAKVLNGKSQDGRYKDIYLLAKAKVEEKKLICGIGDQDEEYARGFEQLKGIEFDLSKGVRFKFRESLKDLQIQKAMKSYSEGISQYTLCREEAFQGNPVEILDSKDRFRINAYFKIEQDEMKDLVSMRQSLCEQAENIRKEYIKKGLKFDTAYKNELNGMCQAVAIAAQSNNVEHQIFVGKYLKYWEHVTGKEASLLELLKFFTSDAFYNTPSHEIRSTLYADLMSGNSKITTGDSMDIHHISTVLPYCSFMVVDDRMKNRVKQHGLDKKYNTSVYSISDYDVLMQELNSL